MRTGYVFARRSVSSTDARTSSRFASSALVVAVAATVVSFAPGVATASTGSVVDPPNPGRGIDIARVTHEDDSATITYTLQAYQPFAERAMTGCGWRVFTSAGNEPTFVVLAGYDPNLGRITAEVDGASGDVVAPAAVARPSGDSIRVSVRRSDLGSPSHYTYDLSCWSDANGDGQATDDELDDVPELGSPGVTHDVSPAGPVHPVERVSAEDRIATSIEVSKRSFTDGAAEAVVLTRDGDFPDALAGTPLAAAKNAPLLLTKSGNLDGRVEAEIRRVLPPGKSVYLLGGPRALENKVAERVRGLGYSLIRLAGDNRYETAVVVAEQGMGNPGAFLLATGSDFPDALSAGAGAASRHGAVLLTAGRAVHPSVAKYIAQHPGVSRYAVGGAAAAADPGAQPIVGADRYETSRKVAETFFSAPKAVGLASGVRFPDAVSGGAQAGKLGIPMLLTDPVEMSEPIRGYLAEGASTIGEARIYGGPAAVSEATLIGVLEAIN